MSDLSLSLRCVTMAGTPAALGAQAQCNTHRHTHNTTPQTETHNTAHTYTQRHTTHTQTLPRLLLLSVPGTLWGGLDLTM